MQDQDDRTLMAAFCATRNEAAFTELVRRHLPLVMQIARRRLHSLAVADEAAQITFSLLAAKADAVAVHPERLKAWLCRTTYLTAKGLARKEARLTKIPLPPPDDPAPMDQSELHDRLDAALNRLPELDRELVLRHCCAGEEYREIAAAVGKSAAACQKRVERALAVLGRGLGGAKTAGVALTAMAAATAKSEALPSAARIASLALQHKASTAGAALGTVSGLHIAACAALAMAGGVAGWERQEAPPAPPEIVRSAAARSRAEQVVARPPNETAVLAPRPVPVSRSLPEVLESIQAQRLGPLVEFLPKANPADLQAIIAEDDIAGFGEGSGKFRAAHDLAIQRWAEIDPAAAFAYGKARYIEGGRGGAGAICCLVIRTWLKTDPIAALSAFQALPRSDRSRLGEYLVWMDEETAEQLAALHPEIAWDIAMARSRKDDYAHLQQPTAEEAAQWIANFLATGNPSASKSDALAWLRLVKAFETLALLDPSAALAQAQLIPAGNLRDSILVAIYQEHPPEAARLAPGQMRSFALLREAAILSAADPEAAMRKLRSASPGEREIIAAAISNALAASDPWRLMEHAAAEPALFGKHAERVLEAAGRSDPQRALSLVRKMVLRIADDPRPYLKQVVTGWLEKDPPAALRWALNAGVDVQYQDLLDATADTRTLLELLVEANEEARGAVRGALRHHVEDGLYDGSAKGLLESMPREVADGIVESLAAQACGDGKFDRGLEIAAMASPSTPLRKMLPSMALLAFRGALSGFPEQQKHQLALAIDWFKNLPANDRQMLAADLESWLADHRETADYAELHAAIQQIKP